MIDLVISRAETWFDRAAGLLFKTKLKKHEGLWIQSCNAIHTVGMRYPIALFFLDKNNHVIRYETSIRPFRFVWQYSACSVVETLAIKEAVVHQMITAIENYAVKYQTDSDSGLGSLFDSNTET